MPKNCDIYHATQVIESIYLPYGKKPTVVTIHDLIPLYYAGHITHTHYSSNVIEWILTKTWFAYTLKRDVKADIIICVSEEVKKQLIESMKVDPEKVVVIPNGIPNSLVERPKPDSVPRVGFLGYLDPRKRVDLLIKAYRVSKHKGELWIAGDTRDVKYKLYLRKVADGDNRIKFLGFWPDNKLAYFYNSIDLLIFTSKVEGYGLPIVEALACGKPVVTLDDALIPYEVKRHTYVVSRKDLPSIIENPPKVRREDIRWACKHKWRNVVNQIIQVYYELLS